MKKTIIGLLILAIIVGACTQGIISPEAKIAKFKSEYDQCGIEHNKELSDLYQRFENSDVVLTKKAAKDIIDDHFALNTSIKNRDIASEISNLVINSHSLAKMNVNSDIMDLLSDSLTVYSRYPAVFDSMSSILDEEITLEEKTDKLEHIYLLVNQVCEDPDDKSALMNGVSTSIHSLNYWDESYYEWQLALNPDLGKTSAISIIGAFAIIDGAGAVLGTLEGIRDTEKGQEDRLKVIAGRAIGEAAKTSSYAALALILI
ncbi:MAG: hypothetical protein WCT23_04060 [Candidatus Neomarinimicrobiota bacterium]